MSFYATICMFLNSLLSNGLGSSPFFVVTDDEGGMMAGRSKTAQAAYDLAEPVAAQMGYDLVDAEYKKEGQYTFLRLFIDKKGGVGIEDCEAFSQQIDPILDEKLKHDADYFEVSSPGLTRPLQERRDYDRYSGEQADVSLFAEIDGMKQFTGKIEETTDEGIVFEIDGRKITVGYKDISKAVRHIEF